MSGAPVEFQMEGFDKLMREFELCNYRMKQKVIAKAGRAALDVVIPLARAGVATLPFRMPPSHKAVRFTLFKSIKKKTSNKREVTVVTAMFDHKTGKATRLAHLFEFGFTHVGGKRMPRYEMMTQAFAPKADTIKQVMASKMRQHIDEVVRP